MNAETGGIMRAGRATRSQRGKSCKSTSMRRQLHKVPDFGPRDFSKIRKHEAVE